MGVLKDHERNQNKIYVCYGTDKYQKEKFQIAKNTEGNFPTGGLWGYSLDSLKDFQEEQYFYFRIQNHQVYQLQTIEDLERLLKTYEGKIDYEAMQIEDFPYFAIEISKEIAIQYFGINYDCIYVMRDNDLIENYCLKRKEELLTLEMLLPIKNVINLEDMVVCSLNGNNDGKKYILTEALDSYYFFKNIVACLTDGSIIELLVIQRKQLKR